MKIFKKVMMICLIASMAVSAFGCSQNNDSSSADSEADMPMETISLEKTKTPLTFVHETDAGNEEATEGGENAETTAQTATTAPAAETEAASAIAVMPVTEVVKVTDAKGQAATDASGQPQTEVVNVTEYVKVTDAAGQPATNAEGQEQTEAVNVTETAVVTDSVQPATLKPDAPNQDVTENNSSSYTPSYDVNKAYWLDMSQSSDFFFEGEFLVYEFKIKEGTPDGVYPLTFEKTDIASWDVKTWTPKIITGEVAVNTSPTAQEDMPDDEFTLKINSVSGKPGDTVKVTVDLKNNPGFCGFVINMKYDNGALELVDSEGGEDFNTSAVNYIN